MCQTTTPIIRSQSRELSCAMSISATQSTPEHYTRTLTINLEKLIPKLVVPGIEPGTSLSCVHSTNCLATEVVNDIKYGHNSAKYVFIDIAIILDFYLHCSYCISQNGCTYLLF